MKMIPVTRKIQAGVGIELEYQTDHDNGLGVDRGKVERGNTSHFPEDPSPNLCLY